MRCKGRRCSRRSIRIKKNMAVFQLFRVGALLKVLLEADLSLDRGHGGLVDLGLVIICHSQVVRYDNQERFGCPVYGEVYLSQTRLLPDCSRDARDAVMLI